MRKKNSIKNFLTIYPPFIILVILGFVKVKIFLSYMGNNIYAVNQLFYQIFMYLSLMEAGFGALITQKYYKSLAKNDTSETLRIYHSSKRIMLKVAISILSVGLIICLFIKHFMNNNSLDVFYIQIAFVLFLMKSVVELAMFAPRFVLTANQKAYLMNLRINFLKILEIFIELAVIILTRNYILMLTFGIFFRIVSNLLINRIVFREYPYLKGARKVAPVKIKGVSSIFAHKISGAVYYNTDIIIISSFLNPVSVAIYASYNYIVKFFQDTAFMLGNAIIPSVGNHYHQETADESYGLAKKIISAFNYLSLIISLTFYYSIDSFVEHWLGGAYVIDYWSKFFLSFNLFFALFLLPYHIIRDSRGLFKQTQIIAITEAVINLSASLLLVNKFGLSGIIFATFLASFISFVMHHYIIFKKSFKKSFTLSFFKRLVVVFIFLIIALNVSNLGLKIDNLLFWFIKTGLLFAAISLIFLILEMLFDPEFRAILRAILSRVGKDEQE